MSDSILYFPVIARSAADLASYVLNAPNFEHEIIASACFDNRRKTDPNFRFKGLPQLSIKDNDGNVVQVLGQSNTILRYVANKYRTATCDLYPSSSPLLRLMIDEILNAVEDIFNGDRSQKSILLFFGKLERRLLENNQRYGTKNTCMAGSHLSIADLKVCTCLMYLLERFLDNPERGNVPSATTFSAELQPNFHAYYHHLLSVPRIAEYVERFTKSAQMVVNDDTIETLTTKLDGSLEPVIVRRRIAAVEPRATYTYFPFVARSSGGLAAYYMNVPNLDYEMIGWDNGTLDKRRANDPSFRFKGLPQLTLRDASGHTQVLSQANTILRYFANEYRSSECDLYPGSPLTRLLIDEILESCQDMYQYSWGQHNKEFLRLFCDQFERRLIENGQRTGAENNHVFVGQSLTIADFKAFTCLFAVNTYFLESPRHQNIPRAEVFSAELQPNLYAFYTHMSELPRVAEYMERYQKVASMLFADKSIESVVSSLDGRSEPAVVRQAVEPSVTLTYFPFIARCSAALAAFCAKAANFRVEMIPHGDDTLDNRRKAGLFRFKGLPQLTIVDKHGRTQVLSQSNAILRYVANEYRSADCDLYPQSPLQRLLVDEILDSVQDLYQFAFGDKNQQHIRTFFDRFEQRLIENNQRYGVENQCLVGKSLTIADFKTFTCFHALTRHFFDSARMGNLPRAESFTAELQPNLDAYFENLLSHPQISEFVARFSKHTAAMFAPHNNIESLTTGLDGQAPAIVHKAIPPTFLTLTYFPFVARGSADLAAFLLEVPHYDREMIQWAPDSAASEIERRRQTDAMFRWKGLPQLTIKDADGKRLHVIGQSSTILRYIASEYRSSAYDLYPENAPLLRLLMDEIVDAVQDLYEFSYGQRRDQKVLLQFFNALDKRVLENNARFPENESRFLVGRAMSVADIKAFTCLTSLIGGFFDKSFSGMARQDVFSAALQPNLDAWFASMSAIQRVTDYVQAYRILSSVLLADASITSLVSKMDGSPPVVERRSALLSAIDGLLTFMDKAAF